MDATGRRNKDGIEEKQVSIEGAKEEADLHISPSDVSVICPIKIFPDQSLRRSCIEVNKNRIKNPDFKAFTKTLVETMYAEGGVGLAAIQIGWIERVIVIDTSQPSETRNPTVMINPVIIEQHGKYRSEEGCLSVPGITATVERAELISLKYYNEDGEVIKMSVSKFPAAVVQHEIDHLNGILFIDRLSSIKKDMYMRKVRKTKKRLKWAIS